MQTRVDAEFVVFIQVEGRKPGYQTYTVQDGKQKSSQNTNDNQNQESEFRNCRQGLGRISLCREDVDWNHTQCLYRNTAPIKEW